MAEDVDKRIDNILKQVTSKPRMILYTDTIRGEQTLRDDLWAISTDEIADLRSFIAARELAAEKYGRADELVRLSDWGKTIDDQWNNHFEKRLAELNQSQDKETK